MHNKIKCQWAVAFFSLGALLPAEAQPALFKLLHSFNPDPRYTNSDGVSPQASLILSGNTLYGTAKAGGKAGNGSVFALSTNGSGFTNLHSFSGVSATLVNSDGTFPEAALVLAGNTLYGTATAGGSRADGTVFAVNTDGSGFTNLHSFTNGSDGSVPQGGLILAAGTLYGTAENGGSGSGGTVFAVQTNGQGFTILHSFTNADGAYPVAGLVLAGNALYGTTEEGGGTGNGTVFAVNTNGSGFTNVYSFSGASGPDLTNSDGAFPLGSLVLAGNTLYGTAEAGGSTGNGSVFAVNTDSSGFTNLHSFTAALGPDLTNSDGALPMAGLVLSSNTLYGTAEGGGIAGNGTVFAVNTNGSGFTNLYTFSAVYGLNFTNVGGIYPDASLIISADTLFGTALYGGGAGNGTVFSLSLGPAVAPYITTNPVNQFAAIGGMATLQVTAIGSNTLAYQWLFNGGQLTNGPQVSGAQSNALTLEAVSAANFGSYQVIVSNSFGAVTSAVATVALLVPPRITAQPASQSVPLAAGARFAVKATGLPLSYQWLFGGAPLSDGTNFSGSSSNVLTINLVTSSNVGSYSVIVSNAAKALTSNPAMLKLLKESTRPSVAITSPKVHSRSLAPVLSGTASDTVRVAAVAYWLTNINDGVITIDNGQAPLTFPSRVNSATWSIPATLLPGTNILVVQSSNYSGLVSPRARTTFFYEVPASLTLLINPVGMGAVTGFASSNAAQLYVGQGYTLVSKPTNNWWLTNWMTNSIVASTNTSLTFIMETNLTVTANFASNLFVGMAARYDGIFYPSVPAIATDTNSGLVYNLMLKTNGVYSGKLYLASGTPYTLGGMFNRSGEVKETINRGPAAGGKVTLELNLLWQNTPRQITGLISNAAGWVSTNLNLCAATTSFNNSSNFTALLPQDTNEPASPPSYGYALMTNIAGMIHMGGALADGTPFNAFVEPINELDQFPVYVAPYHKPGLLLGTVSLLGDAPQGSLAWHKPPQKMGLYTNGFDTVLDVVESAWTNSADALTNLSASGATLTFSGGGLASKIECVVHSTTSNALLLLNSSPNVASGSINRADGLMTLTFTNTSGEKVIAHGTILQNVQVGGGFFPGATNAGTVTLGASAQAVEATILLLEIQEAGGSPLSPPPPPHFNP